MNKTDFIDTFRQVADLPCEIDIDTVCSYLHGNLPQEVEISPEIFSQYMKLSFDILNHINEKETQKHLNSIMDSIQSVMDSRDDTANEATAVTKSSDISEKEPEPPTCDTEEQTYNKGLWQKICSLTGSKKSLGITAFIVSCIFLSPFFAIVAALCLVIYAVPIISASALTLAVLIPTVLLAVLAVVALSYGIASLFTSPPIGLMEMGLGTILFSITIALWAVNFRFFTFVIPFFAKKITSMLKKSFSYPVSFVFGKEVK